MTQEQLGKKAGLGAKHIGVIERGAKSSSFDAVHRLAKALDVNYYELFLPTTKTTAAVEAEIREMVRDSSRIETKNILEFLNEMKAALRNLQRG